MAYILSLVLSIILYLGGGWCIYNIYISIFPIASSDTLKDIACEQVLVYGIWAAVVNVIAIIKDDGRDADDFITQATIYTPIILWFISKLLPLSIGFGILNTAICILLMAYTIGRCINQRL